VTVGLLEGWTGSAAAFRTDHLGRRPLHRPASAATLDSVLGRRGWTVPDLLAGRRKNVTAWMNALDGRHLTAEVPPTIAARLYDAGTTLYLLEVDGLDAVSADVAADLRVPAGNVVSGVFANQPGAYTPMHFDPVDTITVQLRGSKRWWIAPPVTPDPTVAWAVRDRSVDPELWRYAHEPLPDRRRPDTEEHLLTPGSVLYVPRGWWHETRSAEESVSLHVHHVHLPWVDAVLDAVRGRLLRDARWRAGALTLWDPDRRDEAAGTAAALLADLASVTRSLEPADLLPGGGAPAPTGRYVRRAVSGVAFLGAGAGGDREVTLSAIEPGAERRSTVAVGADQEAGLRRLLAEEKPVTAAELAAAVPDLTLERATQLLDLLTDVGFCRAA
jgi:50S ribosomal protein L16 3-hydroxylase